MDSLVKKALGCAFGVALCAGAQAALIDSVRVGDQAILISDTHLYLYNSTAGSVERTVALPDGPIALAAGDSSLFVAYPGKVEKRTLNGDVVNDPVSGGPLTRNFLSVSDIAVVEDQLYVSFLEGNALHELKVTDLSPEAGPAAPYYSLAEPMEKLVPHSSGASLMFFSYLEKDLAALIWPSSANGDGELPILRSEVSEVSRSYLDTPEAIFVIETPSDPSYPQIFMDNGSAWTTDGVQTHGWIDGQEFRFLDQSQDGQWSVVRDKIAACETGDALNWSSDLVHYDAPGEFVSRTKTGIPGEPYEVVHLWGGEPQAHLFRESAPGVLQVDVHARSAGLPYDDGKVTENITADESLSVYQLSQGVSSQHVALNDDYTKAYVLHQGDSACQAAIRVYDLVNDAWIQSIPLRWRPEAIAMVGGDNPDSSDDQLAVVYEFAFDAYGRRNILATFMDINSGSPAEDPSTDFDWYNAGYSDVSTVRATRHAVLFQVEVVQQGSVITAWTPQGVFASYEDCESGETCDQPRTISAWQSRAELGEQAGLILKAEEDIRMVQFTEDATDFTFDSPYDTHTLLDDTVKDAQGPLLFSPDLELFTLSLDDSTALFRKSSQAYSEGKASDFLPLSMDVATWSETKQGAENRFALYSLTGGDVEGTTAAEIQRWVMALGDDGHFEFDTSDSADLAGKPVLVRVVDPSEDDLLLATVYQDQVRFTPVNKSLTNAPEFEPEDSGSDDGDDSGSTPGGDGGGNTPVSGSDFSKDGGGGSIFWLLGSLLLLAARVRKI